ncbi:MAG TPA: hypothetical protein VIQ24_00020 [Pyrinomonadaceae bacterium]
MKKKLLRSLTLLTFLVAALSVTVWAFSLINQQPSKAENNSRKTLRDRARERDVEEDVPDAELNVEYASAGLLARHAEAIVIGQIAAEESSFDGDDHLATTYQVNVKQILKDVKLGAPLPAGEQSPAPLMTPLKIARPGGLLYVNGHKVSKKLRGSDALKVGKDYVFFLWWSPAYRAYTLAGGVSGAFSIENDLTIKSLGSKDGMMSYNGSRLQALVDEIHSAQ